MALERLPLGGSPPPWDLGARFSQKSVWFVCPPKKERRLRVSAFLFVLQEAYLVWVVLLSR